MGAPRGSSEATKRKILRVARELFAERGINPVTVRDVAAAAGVNHALVHRYFGTKEEMVAEVLQREIEAARHMPEGPEWVDLSPTDMMRRIFDYFMTVGRPTVQLIMRAEMLGLRPEDMLKGEVMPISLVADWIANQQASAPDRGRKLPDPAVAAAVVNAAIFGFTNMGPWLMTAVGLTAEDYEKRRSEFIEVIMSIVLTAAGTERRARQEG